QRHGDGLLVTFALADDLHDAPPGLIDHLAEGGLHLGTVAEEFSVLGGGWRARQADAQNHRDREDRAAGRIRQGAANRWEHATIRRCGWGETHDTNRTKERTRRARGGYYRGTLPSGGIPGNELHFLRLALAAAEEFNRDLLPR